MLERRTMLSGLITAPAIVRVSSLMPISIIISKVSSPLMTGDYVAQIEQLADQACRAMGEVARAVHEDRLQDADRCMRRSRVLMDQLQVATNKALALWRSDAERIGMIA